jgi:hypothetical protein
MPDDRDFWEDWWGLSRGLVLALWFVVLYLLARWSLTMVVEG